VPERAWVNRRAGAIRPLSPFPAPKERIEREKRDDWTFEG
jgi:hypothetical protein